MKVFRICAIAVFAAILVFPVSSGFAAVEPEDTSPQQFVQDFYSWYAQIFDQSNKMPPAEVALKTKPQLFSEVIIKGYMADREAQDKTPSYIVSLEFDPFLNGQDTCEPLKTGKVSIAGRTYRVDVFCAAAYAQGKEPLVVAGVEKRNGAWVFVDFYYPGRGDLFSALAAAKRSRDKSTK